MLWIIITIVVIVAAILTALRFVMELKDLEYFGKIALAWFLIYHFLLYVFVITIGCVLFYWSVRIALSV